MCSAAAAAAAAPLRLLSPPLNQSHLSKVEPLPPPPPPKLRGHQRAPAKAAAKTAVTADLTLEQLATQTLTVAQNCPVGSFFPLLSFPRPTQRFSCFTDTACPPLTCFAISQLAKHIGKQTGRHFPFIALILWSLFIKWPSRCCCFKGGREREAQSLRSDLFVLF